MFESLSDRLGKIFDGLRGRGALAEKDVDEALREVRRALLEADVSLEVVRAFVEQVRIHHATEALKHSAKSILDVAQGCGYYDHSAFVKRFKKFTGTTPLVYRRQQRATMNTSPAIALPTVK